MITGNALAPDAVMMSIAQIAERDGVKKPGVSRTVKRLAEHHGLTVERDGQGRVARVNVAEYDHLRGKFGDPSKRQAPAKPDGELPLAPKAESYDEARRQQAWLAAERERLSLGELKGELIRVAGVVEAVADCGQEIVRVVDRLPQAADEIAAACGRDGAHGVRVALKKLAQGMREDIAGALAIVAGAAPEFEEPQEVEAAAAE